MSEADLSVRPDTELSGDKTKTSYHAGSDTDTDKLRSSSLGDETTSPSDGASFNIGTGKAYMVMKPEVETTNASDGAGFSTDTDKLPSPRFRDEATSPSDRASSDVGTGKAHAVSVPTDKTTNASGGVDPSTSADEGSTVTRYGLLVEPGSRIRQKGRLKFRPGSKKTADLFSFRATGKGTGAIIIPTENETGSTVTHLEHPVYCRTLKKGKETELSVKGLGSVKVSRSDGRASKDDYAPWLNRGQAGSICWAKFEITPENGKSLLDPAPDQK